MWDLKIGDTLARPALHAQYGGRAASRISPSKTVPAVLLFLAPAMPGSWFDGWTGPGGHLHFAGEGGVTGTDQRFLSGNRALRDHREEGRELALFHCSADRHARYVGRFELDRELPYFHVDAPADLRRPHDIRRVIVFRLKPLDEEPAGLPLVQPVATQQRRIRTEPAVTLTRLGGQALEPSNHRDTEELHARYASYLRLRRGADVTGYQITIPGTTDVLHAELVNVTAGEVVVTTVTAARTAVWRALGELDDLARRLKPKPRRVLLLPAAPDRDLAALLSSRKVTATWPLGDGFARTTAE